MCVLEKSCPCTLAHIVVLVLLSCADNEDIDVQLEVLKPFSELEVRPGGTHGEEL